MLNKQTISIIKSTVPRLKEQGEALTKHFYKKMFLNNKEVIPFFNPAHQASGRQQKALAEAICAYAAHIDNPQVLESAIELIAQKHSSLQIKKEHYPIVGQNLLESIRDVLKEAASDEVIEAWSEAYAFLANILIARETQIYQEQASIKGGWTGFRKFYVFRKVKESSVITSFYLSPKDKNPLPLFKPGQFITLRIPSIDGSTTMRNYSLSDKPNLDWFRISVKREIQQNSSAPQGYVSNFLHDTIGIGSELEIGPPCGNFFLDLTKQMNKPLVFLAAGVGITPILSMLLAALETFPTHPVTFIHANLNEESHAFKDTIDELAFKNCNLKVHYCYSKPPREGEIRKEFSSTGFIDAELLDTMIENRDAEDYFCGPKPFMQSVYADLQGWNIPANQIHFEFFGPRQELEVLEKLAI